MAINPTPSLNEIMQKAKEMQAKMQQAQQKLVSITAQGVSGGGLVKITLNGQHEMRQLSIDPALLKEPAEVVEGVIIAAYNDAKRKIEELMRKEMSVIAQDIGLPQSIEDETKE